MPTSILSILNRDSLPGVKTITKIVDKKKAAIWLKKGKVADDVFTKMKLNKISGEKLFQDQKFLGWVKYVDDFNAKNPDKATSMIPTLTKNFGDDVVASEDARSCGEGRGYKQTRNKSSDLADQVLAKSGNVS
ncbi:unnamed protein product [Phytophthora fragariaefolia]|uniref:Unnamed protein product n=1 Tax=Phytophthora fragariaefolia TaxID=1490495 RepID=A0A9W6Y588_9STRA|nr:unnamed protein product [Phytophthora fragariaefolia]